VAILEDHNPTAPPPSVVRPTGLRFVLGTWSGRIILVNLFVFLYICVASGSVMMPDTDTLLRVGAKDPALLAKGEYWRLVAPMFIHIGIIHFAVNSYALYAIGPALEVALGGVWFVVIYLVAGVLGNIASAVFSVNLSAGASGAIFGLLGAGFFMEWTLGRRIRKATGRRPRQRAYAATVALNLAFGFMVPFIDNSAHLGGLVAGILLTMAMINLRPNSLQMPRRAVGVAVCIVVIAVAAGGAWLGTRPWYLVQRLVRAGDKADPGEEQVFYFTQALAIAPDDGPLRLKRARQLFLTGETKFALFDVRQVVARKELAPEIEALAQELDAKAHPSEAWQVRRLLAHRDGN
jgi:membrane associated rhomboid family serine protease